MKKLVAALVTLGLVIAGLLVWNHQLMAKQSAGATGSKTLDRKSTRRTPVTRESGSRMPSSA